MKELLTQLDEIIGRTGVSYAKAKEVLEAHDGDVLQAIIAIEQESEKDASFCALKEMMEKSKNSKIKILKDGQQIGEIPLTAGIVGLVGTLMLPRFTAVGAVGSLAAIFNNISMQIEKPSEKNETKEAFTGSQTLTV